MKKIFLLVFSLMVGVTCIGQQIYTSNFVSLTLPKGAYKLNQVEINSLPSAPGAITKTNVHPPYLYKIDSILIGFYNTNQDAISNDIQRQKRFMDELYGTLKKNKNYTYHSVIKDINSGQALIVNYTVNGIAYYDFFSTNVSKTLTLAGNMECNESEVANAEKVLNDVLQNIRFAK